VIVSDRELPFLGYDHTGFSLVGQKKSDRRILWSQSAD
jgi:hypothetical protein